MANSAPPTGTTRYRCPLECGWYHDVPPPSLHRLAELGVTPDPAIHDMSEYAASIARQALTAEADLTQAALLEHLAVHPIEEFVRVVHDLRAEVAQLRRERDEDPTT